MKKIIYLVLFLGLMVVLELGYLSIALDLRMDQLQQQQSMVQTRMERTEASVRQAVVWVQFLKEQHRAKQAPRLLLALND